MRSCYFQFNWMYFQVRFLETSKIYFNKTGFQSKPIYFQLVWNYFQLFYFPFLHLKSLCAQQGTIHTITLLRIWATHGIWLSKVNGPALLKERWRKCFAFCCFFLPKMVVCTIKCHPNYCHPWGSGSLMFFFFFSIRVQ